MLADLLENYTTRNVVDKVPVDPELVGHQSYTVFRDNWWWCVDGDPRKALFYVTPRTGLSPICNQIESVSRALGTRLGYDGFASLVKIPIAYVEVDE